MSLRGVDNEQLDQFDRENQAEPPNAWREDSPAEGQELRWVNEEDYGVLWVESETDEGSPYTIFFTESMDEVGHIIDAGYESLDAVEMDAIKIMEEIEESRRSE